MEGKCMHEFHFIMDREMKEQLLNLEGFHGYRGLSGMIGNIIQVMAPVVRQEHKWGEQRHGRYQHVCNDPDVVREDVHVLLFKRNSL